MDHWELPLHTLPPASKMQRFRDNPPADIAIITSDAIDADKKINQLELERRR